MKAYNSAQDILQQQLEKIPAVTNTTQSYNQSENSFYTDVDFKGTGTKTFHIITLERAVPQTVERVIQKEKSDKDYLILMAPYISDASEQLLAGNGCGYVDYSGNCLISLDNIYISNKGNPNQYSKKDPAKTVFHASSHTTSLILRKTLEDVSATWKLKDLSEAVGCSIGLVSRVKTYLCEQRWASMDKDGLRIIDPKALLDEWSISYSLPDPVNCYTLDPLPLFEAKSYQAFSQSGVNCSLSGFSGGVRYAPVVRYTRAHIWISENEIPTFLKLTGCKPVESGANVIIFPASGREFFADSRIINETRVASPVQIYLDCMQLKGRGEEMAEAIYEKEIRK